MIYNKISFGNISLHSKVEEEMMDINIEAFA